MISLQFSRDYSGSNRMRGESQNRKEHSRLSRRGYRGINGDGRRLDLGW